LGALAKTALAIHERAPIDFRQACRASWSHLPTLILTTVLKMLLTAAGALLLIIPAFYVLFGFSFSYLVVMAEGRGAWGSLKRSWALARNLRLRIFGL